MQLINLTKGQYIRKIGKGFTSAITLALWEQNQMNPVLQANLSNPMPGTVNLIIGSVLAETGAYLFYGQQPSAADNAAFTDNFGHGTPFITGFSRLTNHMPIVFDELKIATDNTQQLLLPFQHCQLNPTDATVLPKTNNIGFTQEKSDFRTTLSVAVGKWTIGPNQYFQYPVLGNTTLTLYMRIRAISNVKTFVLVN